MGDPLPGHLLQRDGRLAVMDVRTGDDGADGDADIGDVQMQFVTFCECQGVFSPVKTQIPVSVISRD